MLTSNPKLAANKLKITKDELRFFGEEPDISAESKTIDLINVYNWYNYICTTDESKQFVIDYLTSVNARKMIRWVSEIDAIKLRHIGWNLRIKYRGGELPPEIETSTFEKLNKLIEEQKEKKTVVIIDPDRPVVSVQDRINTKLSDIIGDFENEIDAFATTGSTTFVPSDYIKIHDIKPLLAKKIAAYYTPLLQEIESVLDGKDEDLKAAYSGWKKPKLKKFQDLLESIVQIGNVKSSRTKNKKKSKKNK